MEEIKIHISFVLIIQTSHVKWKVNKLVDKLANEGIIWINKELDTD